MSDCWLNVDLSSFICLFSKNIIEVSLNLFCWVWTRVSFVVVFFDGWRERLLGGGNERPGHLHNQPTGYELRQGNGYEGNRDGGERQHRQLHRSVMLRKKQRKEVTKGWGKDGNKETWGGVVGNGCVGDFSFLQPGDSAYTACTACTVQASTLQQTAKRSEQWGWNLYVG